MPSYQTTGIVIGRTNLGEADRIVRFLTPDHGKLSAVAKGVRRLKSRNGGHLELLGEVALTLTTGRNLDIITSARLSWYPHQLAAAYARLNLAFAMATAIDRLTEPGHPQPQLYVTFREGLGALEEGTGGPLLELWFKLRLLELLGYRPELARCIICGRSDAAATYTFDAARGGIVCTDDAGAGTHPISQDQIKLWRLLSDYPFSSIRGIKDGPSHAAVTLMLADEFYEYHMGRTFKS